VPELIAEISWSTESIDLHAKKRDYEKAGVREYVVVALRKQQVFWFVRQRGKYKEMPPDNDGIFRSQVFPGLWLDAQALLCNQRQRVLAALTQGLATPEHAAFVTKLAKRASQGTGQ
jgi:Uma2 family endonuclease